MVMKQRQPGADLRVASSATRLEHNGIVYREAETGGGEHHRLAALQARIWNDELVTPGHQLIAADSCGGIVIGAFRDRRPVGFSYGFPAHEDGRVWLHSHQTGVDRDCRGRQVGATLKWLQRAMALQAGYDLITWTFDPLRAANAHFNFAKLGVTARHYKADYYGPMRDPLNVDEATDRLWVEWHLGSPTVAGQFGVFNRTTGMDWPGVHAGADDTLNRTDGADAKNAHAVDMLTTDLVRPGLRVPTAGPLVDVDAPLLRIEVPTDITAVRTECGKAETTAWRMTVRHAFVAAFARGYVATGFTTTSTSEGRRSWYVLNRPDE